MVYTYYARSFMLQYYNAVRQTFLKFKINSRKELKSVALQAVLHFLNKVPFSLANSTYVWCWVFL